MIEKQSFKHQILLELKRFTDLMLLKMDEKNELLCNLVLFSKIELDFIFNPSKYQNQV